jgi:hypothetical protein
MSVSAAERRFILNQLLRLAESDIRRMWITAERQSDMEFAEYVAKAYPQIVDPYHQMAAQSAATIFESDFPDIVEPAIVARPLPEQKLLGSVEWALAANGKEAIDRMIGTAQRAIYDGDRDTTVGNATKQRMRWVRVARPNACAFCRLLASRTASNNTYLSDGIAIDEKTGEYTTVVTGRAVSSSMPGYQKERKTPALDVRRDIRSGQTRGTRAMGSKYHDHCYCTARVIPAGVSAMTYLEQTEPQFADLAQQWDDEYQKARANAGSGDPKKILSAWRTQGAS